MSFASPLFLAGILAASIPIVLHLIHRRQAKLLPIATLRFLTLIPARTIRRRKLEEYILLAARTLLLALLALGAAHPVILSAKATGGATSVAVVLDDSWSMEYRVSGVTRHTEATEAALEVLRSLLDGDRAALVTASDPAAATLEKDLHGLRRRTGAARPSPTASDLLPACRKAMKLLREAKEPNREMVIITDLQARAIEPLLRGLSSEEGDEKIRVIVIDVGADSPRNLSITRVEPGTGVAVAGEPVRVSATIRNASPEEAVTRVSLIFEDVRVAEKRITLAGDETLTVTLTTTVELPGTARGRVFLEADDLLRDDERWFSLPVAGRIPVLLVNGDPSPIPYEDESFYLRAALAPEEMGATGIRSPVNLRTIETDALDREDLKPYRAVILANVRTLGNRAAAAVRAHVIRGGGLLVFVGNRTDPDRLNSALGTDPRDGVLPAVLAAPIRLAASSEDMVPLDSADAEHPLFADLPRESLRDLAKIHVRQALALDPKASGGRVIAKLANGIPFLVTKECGRGRVLLANTTADADWGNLPLRPLFLPLIHRAARWLAGSGETGDVLLGEMVAVTPPPVNAPPPEITDPEGNVRRLAGEPGPRGDLAYGPIDRIGIYQVTGAGSGEPFSFAANVNTAEGDLSRVDGSALEDLFAENDLTIIRGATGVKAALTRSRRGRPIWGWFLGAALLCLLFEGLFANHIATKRAQKTAKRKGAA